MDNDTMHVPFPGREARSWLDTVAAALLATDAKGHITFVNQAARNLLGPGARILGDPLGAWFEHRGVALSPPATLLQRGHAERLECHLSADGNRVLLDIRARETEPSRDAGYLVMILRERPERGRTLAEEHERAREQARLERLAAMGTMVAGFAHEVLNPVASMRALAESLHDELTDIGRSYPHIERMRKVLERMERLVRTSLQFGRPTAPRRGRHRPWTILSQSLETVGPRTRPLGEIRLEVEPDLPDLYADDGQLTQVLVVLLNNALDAAQNPRKVLLRARSGRDDQVGECVRLEVQDEGPGIGDDVRSHIFDPFFTTKASGTGLGLPIAQQLVQENGGRLELSSSGPTTFTVITPIWREPPL